MVKDNYLKWLKQATKELKKKCKRCKKSKNGAYPYLCEHCINKFKAEVKQKEKEYYENKCADV